MPVLAPRRASRRDAVGKDGIEGLLPDPLAAAQIGVGRIAAPGGTALERQGQPVRLPRRGEGACPEIAGGELRGHILLRVILTGHHVRRREDVLLGIVNVALARDLFDDPAQEDVAPIAVAPVRARFEQGSAPLSYK